MKKKQKKSKKPDYTRDDLGTPRSIIHDITEISMSNDDLEKVAQKQSALLDQRNDPVLRRHIIRKQEKLLHKIFKAASQVLTDSHFQIFTMRYVYNLSEEEIVQQIGCVQNYISRSLRASIKKIQKRLRVTSDLKGFAKDRKTKDE